jgi:hypothetical protein
MTELKIELAGYNKKQVEYIGLCIEYGGKVKKEILNNLGSN